MRRCGDVGNSRSTNCARDSRRAFGDEMLLKGGLVLELRLERARTTRDIDLRLRGDPGQVFDRPRTAAAAVGADFFQFDITPDARLPAIVGESVRYVGQRYSVSTRLAGRPFVHPFGLDIGFGDPVVGEIGKRTGKDTLGFAGVPPPEVRVYPVETHVAEKLHAYTLPRARANSRVKDLPDIALLASSGTVRGSTLRTALEATFAYRSTHALPARLDEPTAAWAEPYRALAVSDGLPWRDIAAVHRASSAFLDPVPADEPCEMWDHAAWRWVGGPAPKP